MFSFGYIINGRLPARKSRSTRDSCVIAAWFTHTHGDTDFRGARKARRIAFRVKVVPGRSSGALRHAHFLCIFLIIFLMYIFIYLIVCFEKLSWLSNYYYAAIIITLNLYFLFFFLERKLELQSELHCNSLLRLYILVYFYLFLFLCIYNI